MRTFRLKARINSESPHKIKTVLDGLVPRKSVTLTAEGFAVNATMRGESARDLNRALLSALRRVERKTRLRSEWTCGETTERFFDYVPKGVTKSPDAR